MTSIKDVAEKAGVSVATVSRVFSNGPHVRQEVRDHVLKIADELGYRPNRIASSLRKQSSRVIGLLVSDIRNPFFVEIARAVEDVANTKNMSVLICNTDENPEKEQVYLETLLDELVAGIILSPTRETAEPFQFLLEGNTPVVAIDRRIVGAKIDCVISDNFQSARLITTHLIENGYTHIGAIMGLQNSMTGRDRLLGFKTTLAEHGIEANPKFAIYSQPRELESEAMVSKWLAAANYPRALLTGNSRITLGAITAIHKAGLSIPDDIAIAGFDDTVWMPFIDLGVTVISQPTYEIGRTAAELLFQRMTDSTRSTREVVLNGTLIVRGSTRVMI